jgi:hypothetical protein
MPDERGSIAGLFYNDGTRRTVNTLHSDIKEGREVTPAGRNARDAGLEPGKQTRMNGCSIDRQC